jgi:DNA-binding NarL/FixJ family response regulator
MPVMDGIKTTEYLNKHYPEIKILILTTYSSENLSHDLIKKGANVFLLKDNGIEQVPDAIYTLFKYEHYFAGWSSKKIISINNDADLVFQEDDLLTEQEKTILKFIYEGLSSKQIGKKMHLSYRTIQNKRVKLHEKTKTKSVGELINFAYQNKII